MHKKLKIFGYGSLINKKSLTKTTPSATNIIPCKLHGFFRIFNAKSNRFCSKNNYHAAALNIEKSEYEEYINGIYFEIDEEEFIYLQEREKGYELIKVNLTDYNGNSFSAFTFRYPHFENENQFLFDSKPQIEYLNICLEGAKDYGEEFLQDFLKTTKIDENKKLKDIKSYLYSLH